MISKSTIIDELSQIFDPEIPISIWELGLIYNIGLDDKNRVQIEMTLTSPGCPVAGMLVQEVEARLRAIPEVADVSVELVWDPPWDKEMMSEAAKLQLGFL